MITDFLMNLADTQALKTSATGNWLTGATVDLGKTAPGDIGQAGRPAYLYVVVTTDIVSNSGAGTLGLRLITQPAEGTANAAPSGAVNHVQSPFFDTSTAVGASNVLPAGTVLWRVALPQAATLKAYKRHLGLVTAIGGNHLASGAISARITFGVPENVAYADGANTPA
tara:strand:- start:764 stop:1270 length:507 start_codon:yes stop_codon:yes gene_type:complete